MFVFYDIETTGTNIAYDQILQFAAILTDDHMNEISRFQIRCQLLPWVVPSPSALLVTGTGIAQLTDPNLPTFFEMMTSIRECLSGWGPATFIGYNSMRFDEPLLQRAFWQALLPPYVTVTKGNSRLDLLPIVRVIAHLLPENLVLPLREDSRTSFKLDELAFVNGFDAHRAHDALGDVEATIFIARMLSERTPNLWRLLAGRASKSKVASVLSFGHPVLVFQYVRGKQMTWFGQRVDQFDVRASHAIVALLGYDWRSSKDGLRNLESPQLADMRQALHRVALNKAPVIFTVEEARSLCGITLTPDELIQSRFLASDQAYCVQILDKLRIAPDYPRGSGQLEETIFDGFPSKSGRKPDEKISRIGLAATDRNCENLRRQAI